MFYYPLPGGLCYVADAKRFLRSPALRNALYDSADGKCERCGIPLPDNWHADHVIPWVQSQTTNMFEMAALCPKCNLTKGAGVESSAGINTGLMRPGQRGATQKIWECVRQGQKSITIVLPTRYGKSDVIRASAYGLMLDMQVSRAVILEPASNLVYQILNGDKMREAVTRYAFPPGFNLSTWAVETTPRKPFNPTKANFLAMTTQMATNNKEFFAEWVRLEMSREKRPPIWFIDEAHTGSSDNEWGRTVRVLKDAGAVLVMLTATPFRTDRNQVEGFQYREIDQEIATIQHGSALWEYDRTRFMLQADWETTFKEAWEEKPPALCFINRTSLDHPLDRFALRTGEHTGGGMLSTLGEADSRRFLTELVRDDTFVQSACEEFVTTIRNRREKDGDTAGMVYVGNDRADDDEANAHANQVARALESIDSDLSVIIATSSAEGGQELLQGFSQGEGDVLIVKQMGGVGLDVPRLKVCLDLSTIRTAQAFTQRVCRIATIWFPTEDPADVVVTASYITPDDARSRRLFDEFIEQEGGSAEHITWEYVGEVVEAVKAQPPLPDILVPTGTTAIGTMVDVQNYRAPDEQMPEVRQLYSVLPELTRTRTEAELANLIHQHSIVIGNGAEHQEVAESPSSEPEVVDALALQRAARERVVQLAKRVARNRIKMDDTGDLDAKFGQVIQEVYTSHKKHCGLPWRKGNALEGLDVPALEKLAASLSHELEVLNGQ